MSKSLKVLLTLGVVALVAACADNNEVVIVEPAPITAEPVSGKF